MCRDPYPHVKALVISVYCPTGAVWIAAHWFLNWMPEERLCLLDVPGSSHYGGRAGMSVNWPHHKHDSRGRLFGGLTCTTTHKILETSVFKQVDIYILATNIVIALAEKKNQASISRFHSHTLYFSGWVSQTLKVSTTNVLLNLSSLIVLEKRDKKLKKS